jgi:Lhr-like helicase
LHWRRRGFRCPSRSPAGFVRGAGAPTRISSSFIAPTGGGKTLAGFLPSLVDLAHREATPRLAARPTIHTLYVSPLKALAVDIARNLSTPIEEMELRISLETRLKIRRRPAALASASHRRTSC